VDYNTTTKTRTLQFTTGDKLYVWRELAGDETKYLAGELTMAGSPTNEGASATFEGELKVYDGQGAATGYDFGATDPLAESTATLLHKDMTAGLVTQNADRSLAYHPEVLAAAADVATLMTSGLLVQGGYTAGTGYLLSTSSMAQPIVNCTIAGLEAGVDYKVDYIYGATAAMDGGTKTLAASMEATGGTLAFAFIAETGDMFHGIRLTNTAEPNDTYDATIGQKAFASKVYNLSRRFVNLSSVTTSNSSLTLENGDIVTGTLYGSFKHVKISIADDATVTLDGVDIRGYNSPSYKWAGLTCTGDATIILAEGSTNSVTGFYEKYPGIHVAPGHTLTIQGTGSLTASSNGWGAGIGGGVELACGNIDIAGGDITVTGGIYAAGIGSGQDGDCGNITISGTANVTATGGANGAGIGSGGASGNASTCGTITISGSASVTATGGSNGAGIGSGYANGKASTCGTITISGSASVTAMCGTYSSGIGSGHKGSCSAIVIGSGITQVIAKRNNSSSDLIGKGYEGSCGTVTIDGVVMTADQQNNGVTSNPSDAEHTFEHLASAVSSNTWTLTKAN
jgi:hypothetical protein